VNGINPVDYLADVLMRVQTHPASRIDDLLPHHWKPPAAQPPA
jgi:transposase